MKAKNIEIIVIFNLFFSIKKLKDRIKNNKNKGMVRISKNLEKERTKGSFIELM